MSREQRTADILENIARLKDYGELREFAKGMAVNIKKCTTTDQVRDRLKYHLMKQDGKMKDLLVVSSTCCHFLEFAFSKRRNNV